MRVKLTISYFGKNYAGWQRQPNIISVQEVLQKALIQLTGEKREFYGSGRTDGGVHAYGQVAHINTDCTIPLDRFPLAINSYLPEDVKVMKAEKVSDDFHARYSAKSKTYIYKIFNDDILNPFYAYTHALVKPLLDITAMRQGAECVLGEHDFTSFMATGSIIKNTVRTITAVSVTRKGKEVKIKITGNGFLYNMVRIIAGTLVDVGIHKISPESVADIILAKERTRSGKTMPAEGLYLYNVKYKK